MNLSESFINAVYLLSPIMIGGILHMVVVKANWLSALAYPIHITAFGRNKTWRGLLVIPFATILGVEITCYLDKVGVFGAAVIHNSFAVGSSWYLGTALGLGYALSELPNSFIKRRLGVTEGKLPAKNRFWFALIDQSDCAIGCGFVFKVLMDVPFGLLAICIALGPAIHLVLNI